MITAGRARLRALQPPELERQILGLLDPRALAVLETLERAGRRAWIVGGALRDALLGLWPQDYDIATQALPEESLRLFGRQAHATGLAHGTITVLQEGLACELTTLRVDGSYSDHRRPDTVRFVTDIQADLARRDFSINAIAWSPRDGLLDPWGGISDLGEGLLRAVGDPRQRFAEDALRILRGLRFMARFGLEPETATAQAMLEQAESLNNVARERLAVERAGILTAPWRSLAWSAPTAIWRHAWPRLWEISNAKEETWPRLLPPAAAADSEPDSSCLALLRSCLGRPGQQEVAELLLRDQQLPRAARRRLHDGLNALAHWYGLLAGREHIEDRELRHAAREIHATRAGAVSALALGVLELLEADDPWLPLGQSRALLERAVAEERRVTQEGDFVRLQDLAIDGLDLKWLGIAASRRGRLLHELLDAVVHERVVNDKEALLALALRLSSQTPGQDFPP
ncbi:MAG: hypothetical protein QM296_05795 [Bacillota bacterium]|nr:hypothetical protein [Bacillota bacterium]